ncbi:metal-dependent hydrolase [Desulfofundulus sp. TPOSR]|uniref:metal-dependent hydrolase n=1 Tax=Desulfofundulus sp. TPOSR TaxID=2714340 RepID=UPI00140AC24F|nr:metal-dependent hydrolase [Desulfofundulus sp. TPOSR]NHM25967.1 metal-dependent hydrolase [Desulfofundulus sp. TPOSR]
MTGTTHFTAGAALGAAAGTLAGQPLVGAIIGGVAALLPDVDHPGSYAGRRLRLLACYLEEKWGHRESPTHTVFFAALAGLAVGTAAAIALKAFLLVLAGVLGGVSHIMLDGMTRSGVQPWRVYLPRLPERAPAAGKWNALVSRWEAHRWAEKRYCWEIKTGQDARETQVFAACLVILAAVLLMSGV